ncbi:hypothetical protein WMF39_44395 [Sorangium sp. So ce1504]|uniref:hypothetical protein n=1 Tax=Sorangium sp. So ce1504 TaxID=3133337 RepID=UPI003F62DF7B
MSPCASLDGLLRALALCSGSSGGESSTPTISATSRMLGRLGGLAPLGFLVLPAMMPPPYRRSPEM